MAVLVERPVHGGLDRGGSLGKCKALELLGECTDLPIELAWTDAAARVSDPDGISRVLGEPIDTVRDAT